MRSFAKLLLESRPLSDVEVKQDWWDIPGEASAQMEELLAKITEVS